MTFGKFGKYLKDGGPARSFLIWGNFDPRELEEFLKNNFEELIIANPAEFGIDEARRIKERAQFLSSGAHRQAFLINADVLTREAEAAFLKITEEPPKHTYFIFYSSGHSGLSPVLASRLLPIAAGASPNENTESENRAKAFLSGDAVLRAKMLDDFETMADLERFSDFVAGRVYKENAAQPDRTNKLRRLMFLHNSMKGTVFPLRLAKDALTLLV